MPEYEVVVLEGITKRHCNVRLPYLITVAKVSAPKIINMGISFRDYRNSDWAELAMCCGDGGGGRGGALLSIRSNSATYKEGREGGQVAASTVSLSGLTTARPPPPRIEWMDPEE